MHGVCRLPFILPAFLFKYIRPATNEIIYDDLKVNTINRYTTYVRFIVIMPIGIMS